MLNANSVVLVMAGGTGGHVFPALAVAKELQKLGVKIHWLGTQNGIEADLIPAAGIELHNISIKGLRGKGVVGLLAAPFKIIKAIVQAKKVIKEIKPQVVVGFGGYVTGPGGVAAKLAGVSLIIHEQNAIAGLTNKLLAKISNKVLQAFPNTLSQAKTVGNPVRDTLVQLAEPSERINTATTELNVLVVGGSLGAVAINNTVLAAMQSMANDKRPQLWHQVGKHNIDAMQAAYADAGVQAKVVPFIDDMTAAYEWADLVVCRAGALTVAEVAAAGCAALFVPFPFAVDDHQTANANYLVTDNAALMIQQTDLTASLLAEKWLHFSEHKHELLHMANAARKLAITTATAAVVEEIKGVNHG